MGDLVVGSVAGAGVSELLKVVTEEAKRVRAFKSEYKELASKMKDVLPITEEMERLQGAGERKSLNDTISEARALVDKCSQVKWWNLPAKAINARKIEEVNKKMLKLCQIQLQLMIYRNQLRNMRLPPPPVLLSYTEPTMLNDAVSLGLEAVLSKILEGLIEEAKRVTAFKSVYRELASTMEDVRPIIEDIEMLPGAEELEKFKDIINEARVLIGKCSKVKRWNLPSKAKYSRKIEGFNKKMLDFCQIQLQLAIVRNQLLSMGPDCPVGNCYAEPSPPVYRGPCSVPEIDKVLVGLDLPLMEVKKKLLNDDDDPVCSLVVSAPPGCGKSTLVTQLCHDEEIKKKFKYIFFCNLSKVSTFRTIVQTLLQHNGSEAPTFENDSQAADGLRKLLEELKEEGPILLVLDDVNQGAESFLQKFQINILNFKILVTSRFEFPSFGPTHHLKPLGVEDAKSLLIERASLQNLTFENEDIFQEILKRCHGLPLLIEKIGVQLITKAGRRGLLVVEGWFDDGFSSDESWSDESIGSGEETIFNNPSLHMTEQSNLLMDNWTTKGVGHCSRRMESTAH